MLHPFIRAVINHEDAGLEIQLSAAKSNVVKNLPDVFEASRIDLPYGFGNLRFLCRPCAHRNVVASHPFMVQEAHERQQMPFGHRIFEFTYGVENALDEGFRPISQEPLDKVGAVFKVGVETTLGDPKLCAKVENVQFRTALNLQR